MKTKLVNYLEEISSVLFLKNAVFGLFFIAIGLIFSPRLALSGIFASIVGYVFSQRNRTPKLLKDGGLLTINGFFFGLAIASLLPDSPQFYLFLAMGSLAVPLTTMAANEILQHWKLSPFIISYILVAWVLHLCARALAMETLISPWAAPTSLTFELMNSPFLIIRFITSVLMGMGSLFFVPNPVFGLALLILVTVFSPRQGLFFLAGTVVATFTAYVLMYNNSDVVEFGKYTYSAGLIGLGLASWPEKYSARMILLFSVLSVFVTLASLQFLGNLGLPVLTLPYLLTIWLAILSRTPRFNLSWAA